MSDPRFPYAWMWRARDGRVYDAARQVITSVADPAFAAFDPQGDRATPWPSVAGAQTDEALQAVLRPYGLYVSLDALKAALKVEIDAKAEAVRQSVITPGAGQMVEYQETRVQAERARAAAEGGGKPVAADYPMLAASIGIDVDPTTGKPSQDVLGVARAVAAADAAWIVFGAAVRAARLTGKAAIDAAADATAARAAAASVAWPGA